MWVGVALLLLLVLLFILQSTERESFVTQTGSRCIYDSECNPLRFCRNTGARDPDTDIYIHRCSKNSNFLQNKLDFEPELADFTSA